MPRPCAVALATVAGLSLSATAGAEPAVPTVLTAPAGTRALLHANASGTQDYVCQAAGATFAWTLRGPEAVLRDDQGRPVGHHFVGPTWQWSDKSQIVGALVAKADSPDAGAVPWLLLSVKSHQGAGALTAVRFVQRLDTQGGRAPSAGCDAAHSGALARIPYSARYVFLGD